MKHKTNTTPVDHSPSGRTNEITQPDAALLNRRQLLALTAPLGAGFMLAGMSPRARAESAVPQIASGGFIDLADSGLQSGDDATVVIQSCLDHIKDGATISLSAKRTGTGEERSQMVYRISSTLKLKDRRYITFRADPGVVIEMTESESSFLHAENCDRLLLDGLTCIGDFEPSTNHRFNKIVVARDCHRIKIINCSAEGLMLAFLERCDMPVISDNYTDSRIDAATYSAGTSDIMDPRASGLGYGIQLRNCSYGMISNNIIKNCCIDGIKAAAMGIRKGNDPYDAFEFGEVLIISGNYISGCVNDDAIDIYNSGHKVIITGNVLEDNQKGMNIKQENNPYAPVHEIIVSNNIIIGGRWNPIRFGQLGIFSDVRNMIAQGNIIQRIEGTGLLFGQSSANTIVTGCVIEDIRKSPHYPNRPPIGGNAISDQIDPQRPKMVRHNIGAGTMEVRDGAVTLSNITIRRCEGDGVRIRSASRGLIQGLVIEEVAGNGFMYDQYVPGDTPISITGCRIKGTDKVEMEQGFYFTSRVTGGALISGCVAEGNIKHILVNSSSSKVRSNGNSWDRTEGPSAQRPRGYYAQPGACYFDTDLGTPLWWDGTNWVDAKGVSR